MYREVSATAKKKLVKQLKLAEEPIRVPAHEGRMFDTRYLLEALKGRTNVSKTYGVSYVAIKGVLVLTKQLREWLAFFCQDPPTGEMINIHKWTPENWAFVRRDIERADKDIGDRVLVLTFESEGLDVTTTFKNQFDELEVTYQGVYRGSPVIHEVILENV